MLKTINVIEEHDGRVRRMASFVDDEGGGKNATDLFREWCASNPGSPSEDDVAAADEAGEFQWDAWRILLVRSTEHGKHSRVAPPLNEADSKNFQTLICADTNGDLALLSAVRKFDGKPVALVCAVNRVDGNTSFSPLAVMIEGNPFQDFEDPTLCV